MTSELKAKLRTKASDWLLPSAGEWTFLFHNNYHPHYSNINVFWFHNGSRFPRVVTKVFHEPNVPAREFANLSRVYATVPECAPRPLEMTVGNGLWQIWMQGIPGWRLTVQDACSASCLRSAVDMIACLHSGLRGNAPRDRYACVVQHPLERLASFGESTEVSSMCSALRQRISPQWIDDLPAIAQHGDLCIGNVLYDGRRCCAVDWESLGATDIPFYDLFTFLLSILDVNSSGPASWNRAVLQHVPGALETYTQRIGVARTDARLLLPLTLANWLHLQCGDGRVAFSDRMYKIIQSYCENTAVWEKALSLA